LAVKITPSPQTDLSMMNLMALGLTVNDLHKIERTPNLDDCDKAALKKCTLRV